MGRQVVTPLEALKADLRKLEAERQRIEALISEHQQACAPYEGPLVDREGFPRSDIDVAAVRHHRQQVIRLTNDHKALDGQLHARLQDLHSAATGSASREVASSAQLPGQQEGVSHSGNGVAEPPDAANDARWPFATVEEVTSGSPAEAAGLMVGDGVTSFAHVTSQTSNPVPSVARLLQGSRGQALDVELLRRGARVKVRVVPSPWAGTGLLGARLKPVS